MITTKELKLLRNALTQDYTLYTVQRHALRSETCIRVDCFAAKGAGSPGLVRITGLVAGVLKQRRNLRGLTMSNRDDIERNLVAVLSQKLELELKHERMN